MNTSTLSHVQGRNDRSRKGYPQQHRCRASCTAVRHPRSLPVISIVVMTLTSSAANAHTTRACAVFYLSFSFSASDTFSHSSSVLTLE